MKITIGKCVYNYTGRVLTKPNGESTKLTRVTADLLELFIENPNRYFSLSDIEEAVWKNRSVERATITRWISTLRKELGESPEELYIENKRSQGYRLICKVEAYETQKTNRSQLPVLLFGLSILLAVVIYLFAQKLIFVDKEVSDTPQTLTSLIGQEVDGVYDNNLILFSHRSTGEKYWNIYAKELDGDRSFSLTQTPHDERNISFSPDGSKIAFQRRSNGLCQIIIADLNRRLMKLLNEQVVYDCLYDDESVSISWKNQSSLYLAMRKVRLGIYSISLFDIESSSLVPVIEETTRGVGDYYVKYSSIRNELIYLRNIGYSSTEIWSYNSATNENKKIHDVPFVLMAVAFTDSDQSIVFNTKSGTLVKKPLSIDEKHKVIHTVNYPVHWVFGIGVKDIGYTHGFIRVNDIVKFKIGEATKRIASSAFNDSMPVISQHAGSIAFKSSRTGSNQIWLADQNNSVKKLTSIKETSRVSDLAITPNGETIAYTSDTTITVVDKTGTVLYESPKDVVYLHPTFSSDSETLYYSINYENNWIIEKRSLANLIAPQTVTEGFFNQPCFNNNNCLYFFKKDNDTLYKLQENKIINTGVQVPGLTRNNHFEVIEDDIYFTNTDDGYTYLYKINFSTKELTKIMPFPYRHFSVDHETMEIYSIMPRSSNTFIEKITIK